MMAFCNAETSEYPKAAAAPFSPRYCRASAAILWPKQFALPGVPANTGLGVARKPWKKRVLFSENLTICPVALMPFASVSMNLQFRL